jgi:hypothetical protein
MASRRRALAPSVASLAICAALAASCGKDESARPPVDLARIQVSGAVVKSGPVGEPRWRSQATYALVEARNQTDADVMVTLGGELEGAGQSWPLRRESLRVPAGGSRLFALVDEGQAERQAIGARVAVTGAVHVAYPPPFAVTDGNVVLDEDRAVAAGYVVNTAERDGSAVVIGAFFDESGAPLQRTSTVFALSPGGKRGVRLVGPVGSRSAYLFVGEVNY